MVPFRIVVLTAFASSAFAQSPSLSSIQNPASNIPAALPNGGLAQGSVFVIYGKNLGPAAIVQPAALPLPLSLGGTSIQITVNGTTVNAPMVYSLATQVAAVLPSNTPIGTGTVSLSYNGASGSIPVTVVQSNFGISSVNLTGTGPGVVTNGNYVLYTNSNSAKPGDTVVLWGTGLGPIQGSDAVIPAFADLGTPITVYVGGQKANVVYRGRSAAPGLDQINFQVPAVTGCYVPVYVQTGNLVSNFTTMPVATGGGVCSDSSGISSTTLSGLAGKGNVSIGFIELFQITTTTPAVGPVPAGTTTISAGAADFVKYTALQFSQSGSLSGQPSIGGCLVSQFSYSGTSAPSTTPAFTATGLNAGASIGVTGPASFNLTPESGTTGFYFATSLTGLPAGTYTVSNGAGGSDVPGFMTTLSLPQALNWTNQSALATIQRSQPTTITWTGGGSNGYAIITGTSSSGTSPIVGASFTCTAPVSAGQFTIPAAVLLSLPPSPAIGGFPTGTLSLGSFGNPTPFTAAGLDYAFTLAGSESGGSVTYQ